MTRMDCPLIDDLCNLQNTFSDRLIREHVSDEVDGSILIGKFNNRDYYSSTINGKPVIIIDSIEDEKLEPIQFLPPL